MISKVDNRMIHADRLVYWYSILVFAVFAHDAVLFAAKYSQYLMLNNMYLILFIIPVLLILTRNYVLFTPAYYERASFFVIAFIILLTCLRLPLPDRYFDTLNYHLFLQQFIFFDITNFNFFPNGFWTTTLPLGDRVFYLFRSLLGYRAGTLLNMVVLIIIYFQIVSIMKENIFKADEGNSSSIVSLIVFAILSTEYILLNLSTYLIDLLFVPFIIEIFRITVFYKQSYQPKIFYYIALLFGLATSIKITAFPVGIVIVLTFFWKARKEIHFSLFVKSVVFFFIPLSIYLIHNYIVTGNPIFPYYNSIFKSIYFPEDNFKDLRWSPNTIMEVIFWPIYLQFRNVSELEVYSGRLLLGFIAAFLLSTKLGYEKRSNPHNRLLCFIFFGSMLLWSISTGFIRYGLFLEILSGIIVVTAVRVYFASGNRVLRTLGYVFCCLMVIQIGTSYYYLFGMNKDWSFRPPIIRQIKEYVHNITMIGADKTALADANQLNDINVWATMAGYNSGYAAMLKADIPVFNIDMLFMSEKREVREKYEEYLQRQQDQKIYTIANCYDLENVINELNIHHFKIANMISIHPTFLSKGESLTLLQIKRDQKAANLNNFYLLKEEGVPLVLDLPRGIKKIHISSFIGFYPKAYNWGSDGCRLHLMVSDGEKTVEIANRYIHPQDPFDRIEAVIHASEFSSKSDLKLTYRYDNDPGMNVAGDWLLLVNPTIRTMEEVGI